MPDAILVRVLEQHRFYETPYAAGCVLDWATRPGDDAWSNYLAHLQAVAAQGTSPQGYMLSYEIVTARMERDAARRDAEHWRAAYRGMARRLRDVELYANAARRREGGPGSTYHGAGHARIPGVVRGDLHRR